MADENTETLLDDKETAALLKVSTSWLAKDRCSGRPPVVPFTKLGRMVRYSPAVVRRIAGGC